MARSFSREGIDGGLNRFPEKVSMVDSFVFPRRYRQWTFSRHADVDVRRNEHLSIYLL